MGTTQPDLQTNTSPIEDQQPSAEATPPEQDTRSLRRRVLDLAWPVIGENFMDTLLGIVDIFLVSRLGAEAIAGVGTAVQVLFFVISALSALSVGSAVLVAQAYGARNLPDANRLARQSILWSAIIGLPLAVGGVISAEFIVGLFGLEPTVTAIGVDYLRVTMGTGVVMAMLLLGGGILRGADDSRTPMLVKLVANIVNVGLTYGLIFGAFGLPEMGAVGSAWGTFMARSLALTLLLTVLWRGRNGVTIRGAGSWWPDSDIARQILRIGVPAALEQMLISTAFFLLTVAVGRLGTLAFAAHRIVLSAMSLSFLPGIGFSLAATSLVGQSLGARRPDEGAEAARIATGWALMWMSAIGVLIFALAPQIMGLFSEDPTVIAIGAGGLRTISLSQPFWAIYFVNGGALRGTGNTQFPLLVNATGMWISVGLAFLFINTIGGSLVAVWAAFLCVAPFTSTIIRWRFRKTIEEEISGMPEK
jgi:putative MATE family efflux protein